MRVTELRIKNEDGSFNESYPIGAKSTNVILENGENLETSTQETLEKINNLTQTLTWESYD